MTMKVYKITDCPYCDKLEKLLSGASIEHETVNIDTEDGYEDFKPIKAITNSEMVPTIIIGEQILVPEVSFRTIDMAFKLVQRFLV